MTHTPESDAEIVRRRSLGQAYSTIAAALGMTKNVVLGRVARTMPHLVNHKPPDPKPIGNRQDFPNRGRCLFTKDARMPYHWCGKPTGSLDLAFCPEHARIVYTPVPKKALTA